MHGNVDGLVASVEPDAVDFSGGDVRTLPAELAMPAVEAPMGEWMLFCEGHVRLELHDCEFHKWLLGQSSFDFASAGCEEQVASFMRMVLDHQRRCGSWLSSHERRRLNVLYGQAILAYNGVVEAPCPEFLSLFFDCVGIVLTSYRRAGSGADLDAWVSRDRLWRYCYRSREDSMAFVEPGERRHVRVCVTEE